MMSLQVEIRMWPVLSIRAIFTSVPRMCGFILLLLKNNEGATFFKYSLDYKMAFFSKLGTFD